MTEAGPAGQGSPVASNATFTARLAKASRAVAPPLLFGLRLWVSVCLALYIAFWLELDDAYWAGTTAALVCQPQLGASLRRGWFRIVGTVVGAVAIVALTACFPQNRIAFLAGWRCGVRGALSLPRYSATLSPLRRSLPGSQRRSSRATSSGISGAQTATSLRSP